MTLMEFVEQLDSETKIVVTYYGCIEYRGTVGEIAAIAAGKSPVGC